MPRLYRYTNDSNRGTGYYVRAGVDGNVVTLQADRIAEELYDELDYEAEPSPDGGDELPGRLVWTLHRVGLHYTEEGGRDTDKEELLKSLERSDVQLKAHEIDKLRGFIQENLDKEEELTEVAEDLGINLTGAENSGGDGDEAIITVGRDINKWIVEKGTDRWGLSEEFAEEISGNEDAQDSVRQLHNHEWDVKEAQYKEMERPIKIEGERVEYSLDGILYNISTESIGTSIRPEFPHESEDWKISVLDSYSFDTEKKNGIRTDVVDFVVTLRTPALEYEISLCIMHGHITGLPDMSANDANERNELAHSRLAFLSFLYSACEEFATILDGYELSNPYTRKIQGTVNFFHDERNYGFIERDDALESDNDVFFHIKDVEGSEINEGEQVLFNVIEGDEGPQAKNLKRV